MATRAAITHFRAPSDQYTTNNPCSHILFRINSLVIVEQSEFEVPSLIMISKYLIEYGGYGDECDHETILPMQPAFLVQAYDAVEGAAEACDSSVEQ